MAKMTKEQERAVLFDNGNILISASAGSGKTHTMIERVKRLILSGKVDVDQILAVTFTETAAADMKEKLKKALVKSADLDRKRIYKQLALIPTADISTLHAFCARLIRAYFFVVGLSPDFNIVDEADAKVMRLECVDKTFKEFYDKGEDWFYTIVDRQASARSDRALKELVLSAYAFCDSEQNPFEFMDKFLNEYTIENFEGLIKEYKSRLDEHLSILLSQLTSAHLSLKKGGVEKGAEFTSIVIADLEYILSSKDIYVIKKPLESIGARFNFERKLTEEQEQLKQIVKTCRDKFKKVLARFDKCLGENKENDLLRLESAKEHTQAFVNILKRFSEVYANEKREENLLDFNDLEHFALQILQDQSIRDDVKKRYRYIFIDEYQDTNGVQESIMNLLTSDNLFMVGDVKQSIYGFRGCRPEFFASKFESMQSKGQEVLTLNHNFRSAKAVIDMVNQIFSYSMTKEFFGIDYKNTSKLISGGLYPDDKAGRATLHLLEKAEKDDAKEEAPRVYNILEEIKKPSGLKDNHLASLITNIIDEELGKTYYDVKNECERQITYSDIAILTRNKNNGYVESLVSSLIKHGIPIVSDVKEKICDFSEIAMVVNALKLVDCFNQDIPLASTLISPIGNFVEEDLAKIVCAFSDTNLARNNKQWTFIDAYNYYLENQNDELSARLKEFNQYFVDLRFIADFVGAQGVLNKLVDEKNLASYLFAEHNGKKKVSRLNRLISATAIGGKILTVKEFLDKVNCAPDSLDFVDGGEEDAVKVMTIHASKGLEFPVVIVCGLERNMNSEDEYGDLLFSRKHGLAFKCFDDEKRSKDETILRGVIKEELAKERVREELRLFYVALTRATYSLHLTVEGDIEKRKDQFYGADKFIDYVPNTVPTKVHTLDGLTFTELKKNTQKVIIGQADKQVTEQMKKQFEYQYAFEQDTHLPLKAGVTSVSQNDEAELVHLLFDEPTPDTERGIIAHKILEEFDFDSDKDVFAQVQDMIKSGILTEEQVESVNLSRIQNAITSGGLDCLKGYALFREKVFLVGVPASKIINTNSDETVVLQGIIDLLAVDNDGAIIVDYKYSSLDKNSLKEKYHKQLELYAYATEKVLKKKVKKMVIVNIFTGQTVEI